MSRDRTRPLTKREEIRRQAHETNGGNTVQIADGATLNEPMDLAVDDASAGERMRGMMTIAEDVGPSLNPLSESRAHRAFLARILDEENVKRATRESRIANEQLLRHGNERARRGRDMHIAHWIGVFS